MLRLSVVALVILTVAAEVARAEESPDLPNAGELVQGLKSQCEPWIGAPSESLRSLKYTYRLANNERTVELLSGPTPVDRAMWQGTTLTTGLHWVLADPDRFTFEVHRTEGDTPDDSSRLQLIARVKEDGHVSIVAGNGIQGSWRGYFSHPATEIVVDLDPQTLLPIREISGRSQFDYHDWQQVRPEQWVPTIIEVRSGTMHFRMHFAWQGGAAWLLTHAELLQDGRATEVARISDVLVNDQAVIERITAQRRKETEARQVVREMLDHNKRWLQPELSFDSLEYSFHMPWPNVTEKCAIQRNGPTVFELTQDCYGVMRDQLGERKAVLADSRFASAMRDSRWAAIRQLERERNEPLDSEQLRRYALIGCQFDLPLFELSRVLEQTSVDVQDGEWEGTRCHIVTINVPGRSAFLGCGTMLGFSSLSYVHHLYPAYEVLYIDRKRNVPIHETFISSCDDRRFEIDFSRWVEVEEGQWVPLRINLHSADYFGCRYDFQLVEGRHWLLKKAASWFDPNDKTRGLVRNIKVDEPSSLVTSALEQIQASRTLFEPEPTGGPTVPVQTFQFELGRTHALGAADIVFTLNEKGELLFQCKLAQEQPARDDQPVCVLLFDEEDRLLSAACAPLQQEQGRSTGIAVLGHSTALGNAARYAVSGPWDRVHHPSEAECNIRVRRLTDSNQSAPVADKSGDTRLIDITVQAGEQDQLVAEVQFASQDRMNGFQLNASVAVFDDQGRIIAAGMKAGKLLVKSHIVGDTWQVPLLGSASAERVDRVAVGFSRGQTSTAPMGSFWGQFMETAPIFPIETMLAAEDEGCWHKGSEELERQVRNETLRRGLLGRTGRWERRVAENATHIQQLKPHVDKLLQILGRAEKPTVLSATIRLLGLSGDDRAVPALQRFQSNETAEIRTAAAIAIGMLGQPDGLTLIEELLSSDVPVDSAQRRKWQAIHDDALIALVSIRTDESIDLVERKLKRMIEAVEPADNRGVKSARNTSAPDLLAKLMGRIPDPRYVPILVEAIKKIEAREDLTGAYSVAEYAAALRSYGELAQEFVAERVRRGDVTFLSGLPSGDATYVPAVRELLTQDNLDLQTIQLTVRYLLNVGTPEAIDRLREIYDRDLPDEEGRSRVRMDLLAALAAHGDNRGLPEAFERLVTLAEPEEPPDDGRDRRKWQRELDNQRRDALNVFERAETAAVFKLLEQYVSASAPSIRLAVLDVLERQRQLPDLLKDAIEEWATEKDSGQVATSAARLLSRYR